MGFFDDLFSGLTRPAKTVNSYLSANSGNLPGGSTYSSQVPRQASQPANPYTGPGSSTYASQVPSNPSNYSPGNVPGGSTYDSQVPSQASQPAISTNSSGQSNSGTVNTGGGSGGGSGGGGIAPPPAPAPPPPPPPPPRPERPAAAEMPSYADWEVLTVPDAQANAQYVAQMAALDQILSDFNTQDKNARIERIGTGVGGKLGTVNQSLIDLGWIDPDLYQGDQKGHWDERGQGSFGRSYVANENDFAGRGLTQSSDYHDAVQGLSKSYQDRLNAINSDQEDWVAAQDAAKTGKENEISTKKGTVKANTVADIAKSLGVDADMVLAGFGKGGTRYKRRIDENATGKMRDYSSTDAKSADELNAKSKAAANEKRKAAQRLINEKYQKAMDEYEAKYGKKDE